MVARVYGAIDNQAIVFTYNEITGRWDATVPANLNGGAYLVALWAEDEAGNTAYITTALCTIDTSKMCVSVEIAESSIQLEVNESSLTVVRCEACGRW